MQTSKEGGGGGQSALEMVMQIYAEGGVAAFWQGYPAAANVSLFHAGLNHALIDFFKTRLEQRVQGTRQARPGAPLLNALELFFAGAMAKVIATLFTYPLIRAKVVMMACDKEDKGHREPNPEPADSKGEARIGTPPPSPELPGRWGEAQLASSSALARKGESGESGGVTKEMGLWRVLGYLLSHGGLAGCYTGCKEQIGLTVTKQGINFALREYILAFVAFMLAKRPSS